MPAKTREEKGTGPSRRRTRIFSPRRSKVRRGLLVACLVILVTIPLSNAAAGARVILVSKGRPGRVVTYRVQGSHYGVSCPYTTCWQPWVVGRGARVYRSPRTSGNQDILVRYILQRWDGSDWVFQSKKDHFGRVPRGYSYDRFPRLNFLPTRARYLRVLVAVAWARSSGGALGTRVFLLNRRAEYVCNTNFTSSCKTGPGWVWLVSPGLS